MIIGNRSRFAIQLKLDRQYEGAWMLGRFCYWIGDVQVGQYDLGTSLRDVLLTMERVIRDAGDRLHPVFCLAPAEELYQTLDAALFGDDYERFEPRSTEERWARFRVDLPVDVQDGWRVFLIGCPRHERLILKHHEEVDSSVQELTLRSGEFDAVYREAYDTLGEAYDYETQGTGTPKDIRLLAEVEELRGELPDDS